MAKVIVGLSGGVDSAAAAYLLRKAGHEVIGVTLRTWSGRASRCCEIDDARQTANILGIPYHVFNCVSAFERYVETPFINQYLQGMTPNPCVVCNRAVKWEWMLYLAAILHADMVATGHYAFSVQASNGRWTIRQAADRQKDQSYMLYRLTQEQLARTILPLGDMTKEEVRHIAQSAGLPSAGKPDSQEVCFVTRGSYADYIEGHAPDRIQGRGNIVDTSGNLLGRHDGIIHYTVGQRKGLGLSLGHPAYVTGIRPETNEIVVGDASSLDSRELLCGELNYMGISGIQQEEKILSKVKIRYRHEGAEALLERAGPDRVRIHFDRPVRAAAPGQSAVFYDEENRILGGGTIIRSE